MENSKRDSFLRPLTLIILGLIINSVSLQAQEKPSSVKTTTNKPVPQRGRKYNTIYTGEYLNRIAFPIGGIGAGMFCLEGTGAVSHMSIRHKPDLFNEPAMFAAIHIKGLQNGSKVLEGPVPNWKHFGERRSGNGSGGKTFGLPRFKSATFQSAFPFATVKMQDTDIPLEVQLKGWSPFIPTDDDNSSLPVGMLEYTLKNKSNKSIEGIFSYNSKNFMANNNEAKNSIKPMDHGFILMQDASKEKPHLEGSFSIFTDEENVKIDHCWFRGGWFDPITMAWNNITSGTIKENIAVEKDAPGASLYVPFTLLPGASKTIKVMMAWYVPESDEHIGEVVLDENKNCDFINSGNSIKTGKNYKPWYSVRFENINALSTYWKNNHTELSKKSKLFSDAFYSSTLPAEVMEAVAANLTIMKSPTMMRQHDGRLWNWEGSGDEHGESHGSCTHVWNYAQALPHLFPNLERSLRNSEFCENQNQEGHQGFRSNLPITPLKHDFHAAADGQLGGIMKVYRDWRVTGDQQWLTNIYPKVKQSLDYCIKTWDPKSKGVVEEPHHNTYDIEFWGPDGMCTSFYLGALQAMIKIGTHLQKDVSQYTDLYNKGKQYIETKLYNGEYFIQDIEYKSLNAPDPAKAMSYGGEYSPEALEILQKEGPKYQYGTGCLSDGVLGAWIGRVCGLDDIIDAQKIKSHLKAVHKYNLKKDLSNHSNPQRPSYALGTEGGLLLCSWPKGGKPSLPFVYSDEVWTGIEYQVASHLMLMGNVNEGLDIVRTCRDRYDGRIRNPFDEYEWGNWYARAMSSYSLIQGLTGIRYDAVDKTLYVDSKIGDFTCFISTATGFGTVQFKVGKPTVKTVYGKIEVNKFIVSGKQI